MVSPTTTREVLCVAATRGRESNRIYIDTHYDPEPQTGHPGVVKPQTTREVLAAVLANQGGDRSAHKTIRQAQHEAESWTTLHAEYQTLAKAAQGERWDALLERCGLSADQLEQVHTSEAHSPLLAAFRDAEARGLDIETGLPKLVRGRTLIGAEDVAAVLHGRVDRWVKAAGSRRARSLTVATATTRPSWMATSARRAGRQYRRPPHPLGPARRARHLLEAGLPVAKD